ncbi:MAG: hypothetical protein KF763_17985 [Cyclobacteriaceae bacterium]|nr:hypothetical protein [Cyclobacteriaceae bacterium]
MSIIINRPVAIFYEHPSWFKPLFEELEQRRIPFVRLNASQHHFNPLERDVPYSLVINRISPSAYLRGNGQSIFYATQYIEHLERLGVPVINGLIAQSFEISKTKQLGLLASLGLRFPKSRIVNHVNQILAAAKALKFPVLVKANIGGSGAGITQFDTPESLKKAIFLNQISFGTDQVVLVQEYLAPKDGHIVRVETLNGKFLYAIKVYPTRKSFNLCPADLCEVPAYTNSEACIAEAARNGVKVEKYNPPKQIIEDVERIVKTARLDVGGVEYLLDEHGEPHYYDINALSNFVADAVNIIGFNPYVNLVDYIESRLQPVFHIDHEPEFQREEV